MPQKLREDKIGALSHSAGTITLANSYVTVGGQQYTTGSINRLISTDVTMTANALYMIYVVISSGNPVLRISANVNSTGPAGFTAWKLVGAFTSNTASSFGGFLDIDRPNTLTASATGNPASASSGNPYIFPTSLNDSNGCYNVSTGLFTLPIAARCEVSGYADLAAGVTATHYIYINSTQDIAVGRTSSSGLLAFNFIGEVSVTAGQTVSLRPNATVDLTGASQITFKAVSNVILKDL